MNSVLCPRVQSLQENFLLSREAIKQIITEQYGEVIEK